MKYILGFITGICLVITGTYAYAQFIQTDIDTTKIDIINETEADKRFSTSTFSSVEEMEKTKENWQNSQDILKELKQINKQLTEQKYLWQKFMKNK